MKKTFLIALTVMLSALTYSCGNSAKTSASADEADKNLMTVDQVLADASNLVGDTITVEGVCSHLCKHGGRKAFVLGSNDSLLLRCEAYPLMGKPFPQETIHHPIEVTGILREERIDEEAVTRMEAQFAQQNAQNGMESEFGEETTESAAEPTGGCDTERAARGQQNLQTFADRMADYRARIAARNEKEGKPYLSFYYLDAMSYVTPAE